MIRFACDHCAQEIAVSEQAAGKSGRCSACGQRLTVPLSTPEPVVAGTPAGIRAAEVFDSLPVDVPPSLARRQRQRGSDVFFGGLLFGLAVAAGLGIWMRLDQLQGFIRPEQTASGPPRLPAAKGTPIGEDNPRENLPVQRPKSSSSESRPEPAITKNLEQSLSTDETVSGTTEETIEVFGVSQSRSSLPSTSARSFMHRDKDEMPDGQRELLKIEGSARENYRRREEIDRIERRPLALPRDQMAAEVVQLQQDIIELQQEMAQLVAANAQLQAQKLLTNDPNVQRNLDDQIATNDFQYGVRQQAIAVKTATMKDRNTRISALNRQLRPIEQRLQKLWEELQEARRQWTALREPDVKYGRGDYELLRSVLDEWLRVDGAWPAAHCWGALCAYELGDVRMARDYYERARKFQAETLGGEARSDAQLRALEGLILMKQERGSARAKQSLHVAEQLAEKSKKRVKDWEPFFLVGRSWADGLTEADQRKAIKKFETALKHHPECQSADIWKARIQTTTPFEKLRDLEAGIATLERHWTATGRRSWRLALDLARAYRAAEQLSQSQQLFDQALELAPVEQRRSLEEEWQTPPE